MYKKKHKMCVKGEMRQRRWRKYFTLLKTSF